jgi:predicted transcriptional regulator YdeE
MLSKDGFHLVGHSQNKGNADQLGMEVIGMLWEVGVGSIC